VSFLRLAAGLSGAELRLRAQRLAVQSVIACIVVVRIFRA
jgi:hypothetical protein